MRTDRSYISVSFDGGREKWIVSRHVEIEIATADTQVEADEIARQTRGRS